MNRLKAGGCNSGPVEHQDLSLTDTLTWLNKQCIYSTFFLKRGNRVMLLIIYNNFHLFCQHDVEIELLSALVRHFPSEEAPKTQSWGTNNHTLDALPHMSVFVSNLSGLYLLISGVHRARWPRKADWINVRVTPSSCPSTVLVFVTSTSCKRGNKEKGTKEKEIIFSRFRIHCEQEWWLSTFMCVCVCMKPCSADLPADSWAVPLCWGGLWMLTAASLCPSHWAQTQIKRDHTHFVSLFLDLLATYPFSVFPPVSLNHYRCTLSFAPICMQTSTYSLLFCTASILLFSLFQQCSSLCDVIVLWWCS